MKTKCATCSKQIWRKPSQLKKTSNSFCCKDCHNQYMKSGNEVPCSWCGELIYKAPSIQFARNFCCQVCRLCWLGQNNIEILNLPGHSAGHKAPHLSRLNQLRNPAGRLHRNDVNVHSSVYRPIMEAYLSRKLKSSEVVHHINGDRTDNHVENLQVMSRRKHHQLHMKIAIERFRGGD